MTHAINYRLTRDQKDELACEVHVNGQRAVVLRQVDGKYNVLADPNFKDGKVSAEDLQNAIEAAAKKLESAA